MNFDDYQAAARSVAVYPNIGNNLVYPVLGLNGEAGEVAEKLKKAIRDRNGDIEPVRDDLIKELGDVLWYVASCCSELGVPMGEVANRNIEKLVDRANRNRISGSGDNR